MEREKEAFKSKLFSKVNTWLADFDKKPEIDLPPLNFCPSLEHDDDDEDEQASFRDYHNNHSNHKQHQQNVFTTMSDRKPTQSDLYLPYQKHGDLSMQNPQKAGGNFGTIESSIGDTSREIMQQRIAAQLKGITIFDEMISMENSSMISNKLSFLHNNK